MADRPGTPDYVDSRQPALAKGHICAPEVVQHTMRSLRSDGSAAEAKQPNGMYCTAVHEVPQRTGGCRTPVQLKRAKYLAKRIQFLACTAASCTIRDLQVFEHELQHMIRQCLKLRPRRNVRDHSCTRSCKTRALQGSNAVRMWLPCSHQIQTVAREVPVSGQSNVRRRSIAYVDPFRTDYLGTLFAVQSSCTLQAVS